MSQEDVVVATTKGKARLSLPAPHIVLLVVEGFMDDAVKDAYVSFADQALDRVTRVVLFADMLQVGGYEPSVRKGLTEWADKRKKSGECVKHHVLFKSRIIAMGLQVASLVLGDTLSPYSRKEEWARVLEEEKKKPSSMR